MVPGRTVAMGTVALVIACATTSAGEPIDDLKAEVAALKSRIAELEARDEKDDWLTQERAEEIRGLVEDALADADSRATYLGNSAAGYDDGFVLTSADGNWLLRTNFLMQQRFIVNSQEDGDLWGFENTRSTFTLSGNVLSPDWFYRVEINVGSNGGGLPAGQPAPGLPADVRTGTLDAYAGHDFGNGFRVWGGSFKAPLLREDLVDSMHQQAVERSVVNYLFTAGRVEGVAVAYTGKEFRVCGAYHDGNRSGQTAFGVADTRFAFTVRGEYLVEGTWDQFFDITSPRGQQFAAMVGGAMTYQTEDSGAPDLDLLTLTADGSLEFGGGNFLGSVMYSNQDTTGASNGDMLGLVLQGGYYINDSWEAYGRFEWADLANATFEDTMILTVGVVKYLQDHRAKWTTDLGVAFNEVRLAPPITGFRADGAGEDGQLVIRTQLQIAF